MKQFEGVDEATLQYESSQGHDTEITGEIVWVGNRGAPHSDFTTVVIDHPYDERLIYGSRGSRFVYSLRTDRDTDQHGVRSAYDDSGNVKPDTVKNHGRKIGELDRIDPAE